MAEARVAVNSLVGTDAHKHKVDPHKHQFQLAFMEEGMVFFMPHPRYIGRGFVRFLYRFRNKVVTALWPLGPFTTMALLGFFSAVVVQSPHDSILRSGTMAHWLWSFDSLFPWTHSFPLPLRVFYLAFASSFLFLLLVMFLQRMYLRLLLNYMGWMNESSKPSLLTKIWGICVRVMFLQGRHPLLYSFQSALPYLPLPSVKDTCARYLQSVKPILSDSDYENLERQAKSFEQKEGKVLQSKLVLKRFISTNYVSEWWERFVYLRSRGSLLINSNYYGLTYLDYLPTNNQAARAAVLCHQFFLAKHLLDREKLEPMLMRRTIPICMNQYKRIFSTDRVPGLEEDQLQHYESTDAKHVAVLYGGVWCRLDAYDSFNLLCTPAELEKQIKGLMRLVDSGEKPTVVERSLPALTTMNRTEWAEIREKYFAEGLNKTSLSLIERAAFVLCLDAERPTTLTEQGHASLCGTGINRWADKSFSLLVYANGNAAIHAEHSFADAPAVGHIWEIALANELATDPYKADGTVKETARPAAFLAALRAAPVTKPPVRLVWDLPGALNDVVSKAVVEAQAAIADLHLNVMVYNTYGKKLMKNANVSPDAFVQMALQLAFFRDQKKIGLTYESSMTRLFQQGRTETIRSVSTASANWVRTMMDPAATSDQKREALRLAGAQHQVTTRNAMTGAGVDRHLFALFVVAKGTGTESKFLSEALSMKWNLSTSQLPQRQTEGLWPEFANTENKYLCVSGGFGPVDDNGYGVCYMIANDTHSIFHISSKRSAAGTDSDRFAKELARAFDDMKLLLSAKSESVPATPAKEEKSETDGGMKLRGKKGGK